MRITYVKNYLMLNHHAKYTKFFIKHIVEIALLDYSHAKHFLKSIYLNSPKTIKLA